MNQEWYIQSIAKSLEKIATTLEDIKADLHFIKEQLQREVEEDYSNDIENKENEEIDSFVKESIKYTETQTS